MNKRVTRGVRTARVDFQQIGEAAHAARFAEMILVRDVLTEQIQKNIGTVGHDNTAVDAALLLDNLKDALKGVLKGNDLLQFAVGARQRQQQQERL